MKQYFSPATATIIGLLTILDVPTTQSAVLVPPQPGDQLTATVSANVTRDTSTDLYQYSYEFRNDAGSAQEIWRVELKVNDIVSDATSPEGWTFLFSPDHMTASWAATDLGELDPNEPDDGGIPPSPYQIKPGQKLGDFSFKSPSPPEEVTFFAQGYTPLPVAEYEEDFLNEGYELKTFEEDSFRGSTQGPMSHYAFTGNRRPGIDGFLVFSDLQNNASLTLPATIVVEFSIAGERVDRDTFHATLNSYDVTEYFVENTNSQNGLIATFELGSSPIRIGKNKLLTSVIGEAPGTEKQEADTDRITFTAY